MFCPECEEKLPDTTPTFSDSNVEFVSSLREDEFPELAVICTILNEATAYIIRGFLENENIPCQLENISFHAGPAPVADLMKVRLWAKKEDVERTESFLKRGRVFRFAQPARPRRPLKMRFVAIAGEKLN